jgi:hypothetical protein
MFARVRRKVSYPKVQIFISTVTTRHDTTPSLKGVPVTHAVVLAVTSLHFTSLPTPGQKKTPDFFLHNDRPCPALPLAVNFAFNALSRQRLLRKIRHMIEEREGGGGGPGLKRQFHIAFFLPT